MTETKKALIKKILADFQERQREATDRQVARFYELTGTKPHKLSCGKGGS